MEKTSRKKAIREKCIDCCCGNRAEVRRCTATDCPLWWFRMGSASKAENGALCDDSDESETGE